ncbi:MAG: radical SAM protein [Anaerolineales bacterium]
MKILLILPRDTIYRYRGFVQTLIGPYAPLTLVTLAALVPPELNAQIDILDEGIQKPDYENKSYDVVGITCVTPSANRAYELAAWWRSRGAFVVLGGAHPTLMPDEAQEHADAVVVGLAEETWPQLLRDFKAGTAQKRYQASYTGELSSPMPRRDLFPRLGYLPMPTVVANRGCSNHCFYCVVNQGDYARCVVRPTPEVVDEIRSLRARRIMFLDPNLVSNREYAKNLLQALIPLKLKWMALAPSDITDDRELFGLMARSGCEGVMIGFESFSQASMDQNGKKFNQVKRYKETVETLHRHGMVVSGCFVLGFDGDTPEILARTAEAVYDIALDFPRYALLTPFPGSRLFARFKSEGRLITEDWSLYDSQHVVFQPKHMTPAQLQQVFSDTLKQSFSYRHIFHRAQVAPHSRLLSLMANWGLRQALAASWKEETEQAQTLPAFV